jgi:hypothetical protein
LPTLSSVAAGTLSDATTLGVSGLVPGSDGAAVPFPAASCDAAAVGADELDVALTITMVPMTARTKATGTSAESTGCRERNLPVA